MKIHLAVDCHPYQYSYYVFCTGKMVFENEYDKWKFTDKIEEVTCKRCLIVDKKLSKEMPDIQSVS